MTTLRREQGSSVTLERKLASGGQGTIYRLAEEPHLVAKIYHNPTAEDVEKLKSMLAKPPSSATRKHGHITVAWPIERLFMQGRCVGFLMPFIGYRTVPLLKLYNQQDRLQTLPDFSWKYLLGAAANLALIVATLHDSGYVIGDLNESNILVSVTALVTLVDCDSMQVPKGNGQFFRSPVGKGDYTPPELLGRDFERFDRAPSHDNFGLAVLIFMMLMEGRHPFDVSLQRVGNPLRREEHIKAGNFPYVGNNQVKPPRSALPFDTLPPSLRTLMVRCFVDGHRRPEVRPEAQEWYEALSRVTTELTVCQVNGQHWYSKHLRHCPWCTRTYTGIPDPFPPIGQQAWSAQPAITAPIYIPPLQTNGTQQQTRLLYPMFTPVPPLQTTRPQRAQSQSMAPLSTVPVRSRRRAGSLSRRVFLVGMTGLVAGGAVTGISWWLRSHDNTLPLITFPSSSPSPGTTLYTYKGHTATVSAVVWSPDGTRIASGSLDKTVQVWNATTGDNTFTYRGHSDKVWALSWSPNGKLLASASNDTTVQIWDASTGQHSSTYHGHSNGVFTLAWAPDGKRMASGGDDGTVQVWNAASGQRILTYLGHASWVSSTSWAPNGKHIASASADGTVQVWNATTGYHILSYHGHSNEVWTVAWSLNGKYIASGGKDKTVQVWDASTGHHIFTYRGHTSAVEAVAWSPDSKQLASASDDHTVQVWDALTGDNAFTYHGHSDKVWAVAWSSAGQEIVSGSSDKTAQVWEGG